MNILLISTNRNQFPMPVVPFGACMVADAASRAGHQVRLLDVMFEDDSLTFVRKEIARQMPDVVGLSVRNIDNNDMQSPVYFLKDLKALIAAIREMSDAPVVLGGAAVSVMPEELLRYSGASCVVPGDGETVFPLLLEGLLQRLPPAAIPGVGWLEDGVFMMNPAGQPKEVLLCRSPDFGRWIDVKSYVSRLATVPVQTKLGCRFACVYCTYRKIEGSCYRLSDPGEVADAVARLASSGLRSIEMVDNVFNSPYEHALAVCEKLVGVRPAPHLQSLELNPLFIDDALLSVMERAGFAGIGITVESASGAVLEGLRKGFTAHHVHKAAEVVRRHRLPCVWIFMLGGPNETQATVRETLDFAEKSLRPQDVAFFGIGIRIYPGTELDSISRRQGLLSLTRAQMLEPVFYVSPTVDYPWLVKQVKSSMDDHMNFMGSHSLSFPLLPMIHRAAHRIGLRPPLWRHTRHIRRGLRFLGVEA